MKPQNVQRYKELMRGHNLSNYFATRRDYVLYGLLNQEENAFFADVSNHFSMPNTVQDSNCYFLCTVSYLWESYRWEKKQQTRLFNALVGKNYLDVKRKGTPPTRWVFVNIEKIINDLGLAVSKQEKLTGKQNLYKDTDPTHSGRLLPTHSGRSNNTVLKNKKNTRQSATPPSSTELDFGKQPEIPEEIKEDRNFAIALKNLLDGKGITDKRTKVTSWIKEFTRLRKELDGNTKRIGKVLEWYSHHIGKEFDFQCYSGESFRKKFTRMEAKMKRNSKTQESNQEWNTSTDSIEDEEIPV